MGQVNKMSDLISRQAAIDAIRASTKKYTGFMEMEMYTDDDAVEAIKELPSAQPEIIHCRDCKHWQSEEYIGNNNVHTLNIASLPCKNWLTGGDWYCGSAERKDI